MTSFAMFVRRIPSRRDQSDSLTFGGKTYFQMDSSKEIEYVDCEEDTPLIETFFDASPEDVMHLIEREVEHFLQQLTTNQEPSMSVITRSRANAVFCRKEEYIRMKLRTTRRKLTDGKRFQGLWKVMQVCYTLCRERKSINQRELYYMNTDVWFLHSLN